MDATLLLEDGTLVRGQGFGAHTECIGEVVFNTAMSGYEEVLSDPSYGGQIVLFTASHIGNTGITRVDLESEKMHAEGLICKEFSNFPDNQRSVVSLGEFLREQGKCAISGVDTRFLAQKLRQKGCMMGILSTTDSNLESLQAKLAAAPRIEDLNLAPKTARKVHDASNSTANHALQKNSKNQFTVAVLDFGIKKGILDSLAAVGCQCVLFSAHASVSEIRAIRPDGFFLSNGPGDPRAIAHATGVLDTILALSKELPTFGICMGHQLLGLAFGASIEKLKFGHHAVNHPVAEVQNSAHSHLTSAVGLAFITSQNHNYVVSLAGPNTLEHEALVVTHVHLNDQTLAGMRHRTLPLFSVQFHPESNPGPRDACGLFDTFVQLMEQSKGNSTAAKKETKGVHTL